MSYIYIMDVKLRLFLIIVLVDLFVMVVVNVVNII